MAIVKLNSNKERSQEPERARLLSFPIKITITFYLSNTNQVIYLEPYCHTDIHLSVGVPLLISPREKKKKNIVSKKPYLNFTFFPVVSHIYEPSIRYNPIPKII